MARFEKDTVIKAPPDKVFAYVADLTKHSEWGSHHLEVKQTSSGAVAVGSTFSSTAKQFGTQKETQTITELAPGTRLTFDAKGALGVARHSFDVAAADGGTRLTKSMELTEPSFLAKVMGFRTKRDVPKALAEDVRRIKAKLES